MTTIDAESTSLAELERYGLSVRNFNMLEEHMGIIYVGDLRGVTEEDLRCGCQGFGVAGVNELRRALRAFLEGRPVKTVEACIVSDVGES